MHVFHLSLRSNEKALFASIFAHHPYAIHSLFGRAIDDQSSIHRAFAHCLQLAIACQDPVQLIAIEEMNKRVIASLVQPFFQQALWFES